MKRVGEIMIHKERYLWLFFLIGSVVFWQLIIPNQIQMEKDHPFGPEFFPNLLALIVMIISGLSFLGTFIKKRVK